MPERFEIYIVYKRRYISTLPFLFSFTRVHAHILRDEPSILNTERPAAITPEAPDRFTDCRVGLHGGGGGKDGEWR